MSEEGTVISQAEEYDQLLKNFHVDMFRVMRSKGQMGALAKLVKQDSKLQKFLKYFPELVGF